jgi:uncharacterized protein (TIGR03435 family)
MRTAVYILVASVTVVATTAQTLSFDVASVKLNRSGAVITRIAAPRGSGRFDVTNGMLHTLILNAYGLQDFQLVDGPSWISNTRFDIAARTGAAATRDEMSAMLRTLLADRFHLVVHYEPRDMATFALTVARADGRLGPQLKPSTTDCVTATRPGAAGPPPTSPTGQTLCGTTMTPNSLNAGNMTMARLATTLGGMVGRMVSDETGLPGSFDLQLTFTPDRGDIPLAAAGLPTPAIDPNAPSIFAALSEQLGLKLEPRRAAVDVLVIDRVELPAED